jgi:hypothetical protein
MDEFGSWHRDPPKIGNMGLGGVEVLVEKQGLV